MLKEFFKKRRLKHEENKATKQQIEDALYFKWEEDKRKKYEPEIAASELRMTNSYCPIVSDNCIGVRCIHYSRSRFRTWRKYEDSHEGYYSFTGASCKLWKS